MRSLSEPLVSNGYTLSAHPKQEPTSSPFPPLASPWILQGLRRRRLSRRTAALLLVLALLILGSACDHARMHLSPARTPPTATANSVVYVGSNDGSLYALDAASGTKKWAYRTGDVIYSSPIVVNGLVYVGSSDSNLYALDVPSGAKKWAYHTGDGVNSSPAVSGGVVSVGSVDGSLYALHVPGT